MTNSRRPSVLHAHPGLLDRRKGLVAAGGLRVRCALGRGGTAPAALKREGDGRTPLGRYRILEVLYRPVSLPVRASAERLWRDDGLYDLIVVLDHNMRPRIRGRGSAVFLHAARDDLAPTEGCVALPLAVLRRLLARLGPGARLQIG